MLTLVITMCILTGLSYSSRVMNYFLSFIQSQSSQLIKPGDTISLKGLCICFPSAQNILQNNHVFLSLRPLLKYHLLIEASPDLLSQILIVPLYPQHLILALLSLTQLFSQIEMCLVYVYPPHRLLSSTEVENFCQYYLLTYYTSL